ncbi:hypothetical protein ACFWN5_38055 [Streptomyces sp. NPDC058430]
MSRAGCASPVFSLAAARIRARTVVATRENSDQRIQEFQHVTWPWSRPA